MSMSDVGKFLAVLQKDSEAKAILKQQKVDSDDEAVAVYVSLAEKMGFSITSEEMSNGLKGCEEVQKMMSKHAASSVKEALDEGDLEKVAGGAEGCDSTHSEGEWCWFNDSCSVLITGYEDSASEPYLPTETLKIGKDGDTPMPVPGDELTGDTMYTELYNGCQDAFVGGMRVWRAQYGYIDS